MTTINWNEFGFTLWFCLYGFIIHLLLKLIMATKKTNFSFKIFIKRQWLGWIAAWLFCMLGVYLAVKKILVVPGVSDLDVLGILIGYTGGSLGKNATKLLLPKTNKEINE